MSRVHVSRNRGDVNSLTQGNGDRVGRVLNCWGVMTEKTEQVSSCGCKLKAMDLSGPLGFK